MAGGSEKQGRSPARVLRNLLRRRRLASLLARDEFRDAVVTDVRGAVLVGNPALKTGRAEAVEVDGRIVGQVYGQQARVLASILCAYAELGVENRALATESLDKYRELSMLYNVSERLLAAPDVKDVAALVCEEAQRFLHSDSVSVLLLNEETETLELVQSRGRPYHSRSFVEIRDDLVGTVLRSGAGEIVNDVQADTRPVHADGALHSVICSPLKSRGRVVGVVVVGSEEPRDYDAAKLQLLNALASQAAAAIDVARLYGALKRTATTPADLIYGVDDHPPFGTCALLGTQHVFIAFIFLVIPVLVAAEAGIARSQTASIVSMSLIAMGIVTLLQVRRLGPVGAGYLAPQITSAIYLPPALLAAQMGGIGLVFGMTFLSGVFGLVFSQIIGRLRKLFPPEVCGVVVLMIGLSIIRVALPLFFGIEQPAAAADPVALAVGIITLTVMISATISRIRHIRLYATVVGLLVGYAAAAMLGLIDATLLDRLVAQPWFGAPPAPSFDLSFSAVLVVPFLIATIASNIKLVGLITSVQKANDLDWKRPDMPSVRGGIVADSLGNMSSGLLGGVGTSIGAGNVGLAAATGATSYRIGIVVGLMFIALAFVPKLTAAIAMMPAPVMGAGLLYTACFLVISGLELIVSRLLDSRRTFVVGLAILAGVSLDLLPHAFAGAPTWAAAFLGSPLAFSTTLAVALNLLLNLGVAKKARLALTRDAAPDDILRFFDRWGAAWGARPDVVRRAGPAAVDAWEEVHSAIDPEEIVIDIAFDEFHLSVDLRWAGDRQAVNDSLYERLAGHLRRRYDCRVRLQENAGAIFMRLEFEH